VKRWFPVARGEEVVPRHVVHTQLLGQELAVWRDDAGAVNAWENRCPHRGVRLTIGTNTGTELRCRYHGWRYAGGSGQCSFIPAHPTQKPASTLRARVFPVLERGGYVWVTLETVEGSAADASPPAGASLPALPADALCLRSLFVRAPAARVAAVLLRGYRLLADNEAPLAQIEPVVQTDEYALEARPRVAPDERAVDPGLKFWLQPMSATATTIHAQLGTPTAAAPTAAAPTASARRLAVLRHHNTQLTRLRDEAERFGR